MANTWLRLWHDMPNDPKWRTIARASKQSIAEVMAVYVHLLTTASANATERGRTDGVCSEDIASALDMGTEQVKGILAAMEGRVVEQGILSGWDKRQPEKEDGAAERARAWREKQKEIKAAKEEEERNRTQPNATERQDKDKDKDKDLNPSSTPVGETVKFTDDDLRCAEFVFSGVKRAAPKSKQPNLEKWADVVRLMREVDELTHREIAEVFSWANQDPFWSVNILSITKLREKFAALSAKRDSQNANTSQRTQHGFQQDRSPPKLSTVDRNGRAAAQYREKLRERAANL